MLTIICLQHENHICVAFTFKARLHICSERVLPLWLAPPLPLGILQPQLPHSPNRRREQVQHPHVFEVLVREGTSSEEH